MKHLTLHDTESDYNNLVIDETNIPHVADILETGRIVYIKSTTPEGYSVCKMSDNNLYDKTGKKIILKN